MLGKVARCIFGSANDRFVSKQHKIVQTAELYIKEFSPKFDSIRFDAICLLGEEVTHIPHAFTPRRSTL